MSALVLVSVGTTFRTDKWSLHCMISGMSETFHVQLFYGLGEVMYGPELVDLTMFSTIMRDVKKSLTEDGGITIWCTKHSH
jgi:hypothetical protein